MKLHLLATALIALTASVGPAMARESAKSQMHRFAQGKGEVSLPIAYHVAVAPSGTLEARTAGPDGKVHLFLDLHVPESAAAPKDAGAAFVRFQAEKKGLKPHELQGKVVLMEPGPRTVVEGAPVVNMNWQIGFGDNIVVMTLSVREVDKDAPELKRFFEKEMEPIIASLKGAGA
jgi:hypothetical protein